MSEKLVCVSRGEVIECIHRGDVVVVDLNGDILHQVGDPHKFTYFRSAAKPIQAINVLVSGAFEKYNITKKELAVICSSHYAEETHLSSVESILQKIGLEKSNVLGGIVHSLSYDVAIKHARDQKELDATISDCSGKHSGMLAVCKLKNYSIHDYLNPEHPLQREILQIISDVCDISIENMKIGIDGCSAPVHAMPLYNMALGYARISNASFFQNHYESAANKIFEAMTKHPEMVSGTNGFCSEFIAATNKRMIGKVGAEGVYCVGIKDKGIGIAVKIENGNMKMLSPVVIEVLNQLDLLTNSEKEKLKKWHIMDNTNDIQTVVGSIYPDFKLD